MFNILDDIQKQDVVAVEISDKIEKEDYEQLTPLIEQKINQYGNVKMYFELDDIDKMDVSTMWKELKFDGKNSDKVSKVAIVGKHKREKFLTQIKSMLTSGETKFFKPTDKDAAIKWL